VQTFFGQGEGFFRCRRPTFWCKNHRDFRSLWCVRTDKGEGLSQCGHFSD